MVEAERSGPQGVSDVCYAVASHDVESKASCSRHDAWIIANAAAILIARDVPDIVVTILNTPVPSYDAAPLTGTQLICGGDVGGDLTSAVPQSGGGAAQPGFPRDTDDGFDEGAPLGRDQVIACGKDFDGAIFPAGAAVVL